MGSAVTHLLVPGLLGPMPRLEAGSLPRLPNLERLLARADQQRAASGYEQTLFELFGLPLGPDSELPTAAIRYLADTGLLPAGPLLQADPVHLRADQDRLLLFNQPADDLDATEAAAFVETANRHFADDGWRLEAPSPGRWYLHVPKQPRLHTRPTSIAVGRNIDLVQPSGADAGYWQQCLTELQMLFYSLPANAERVSRGKLPVSSLWLHGGGEPPEQPLHGFADVTGDDVLASGLQALSETSRQDDRLLIMLDAWRAVQDADAERWLAALQQVEGQIARLMEAGDLTLYPASGRRYRFRPGHRLRLWRRARPLSRLLAAEPDQTL